MTKRLPVFKKALCSYHLQRERQCYQPVDGWRGLAGAVVIKAMEDLRVGTPLLKLDAALFLAADGPEWLDFLGIN